MFDKFNTKNAVIGFAVLLTLLLLVLAPHASVNLDEHLHYGQAKKVVNWYFTLGKNSECLELTPLNLRYYGQSIDNFSALLNRTLSLENEYLTRHILGALIGGGLLLCIAWLTHFFTGSYLMSLLAMLLLFISPRPFGQIHGNLKDLPFALGYLWSVIGLLKFIRQLPMPTTKTTVFLAFGIAFTNSIRIGGLIFLPYIGLFVSIWLATHYHKSFFKELPKGFYKRSILILFLVIGIGYFAGLVFWPYGLQDPLVNPLKALSVMSHYSVSIRQVYEGKLWWSTHLPWYYLLDWIAITIPEFLWIALLSTGVAFILKLKQFTKNINVYLPHIVLFFCALFPVGYVIAIGANLYSGWRQLYFVYPLLLVMGIAGIYKSLQLIEKRSIKLVYALLFSVSCLIPIQHITKTFPVHYVYFNALSKLKPAVWSQFEYDYYCHGIKEAWDWAKENLDLPKGTVIASNLNLEAYLPDSLEFRYVHFNDYYKQKWDYALLSNNYVHPYQLKNDTWSPNKILKTFHHQGNPYVIITKWDGGEYITGMQHFSNGNYEKAIPLFQQSIKKGNAPLSCYALLGECYLQQREYCALSLLLKKVDIKNPYYEPVLFLKARAFYNQKKYEKALFCTKELLAINSKYQKAFPLLVSCYEKTGNMEMANKIKSKLTVKFKNNE